MKTSLQWLKQYFPFTWNAGELAEILTLAGLEVESIQAPGQISNLVVVGRIVDRNQHPNADKLSVCLVDVGDQEPLQIVCGATNCEIGNKVPVALPGTVLAGGYKIKRAKLRGVASDGMMCSSAELGIGEQADNLLVLEPNAIPGTPVHQHLTADTVIDWEVTPNRPDWLCHLGIAREIAALAGQPESLQLPRPVLKPAANTNIAEWARVEVADSKLCPRYTARVLRKVKISTSPEWLQNALESVGIRPINNVVDVTNYVMMECGQPLHAFDYDKLTDHRITVRRATDGEEITTLDGKTHQLTPDQLLIADGSGGIALAGVMGGFNSEISPDTTTVLLESAAFNPNNIRATARQLAVNTESSYRFERGVGLEMVEFASRRAAAMLQEIASAELIDDLIDVYPAPWQPDLVPCRLDRVNQLLGTDLKITQVVDYLQRLGLTVAEQGERLVSLSIPSFRLDLEREVDLIEEVARLYGLDNIPPSPAGAIVGGRLEDDAYIDLERARDTLLALGLTETMTYSTIAANDALPAIGGSEEQLIKLTNPISAEAACMRPSLLPGLLRTTGHNIAHNNPNLAIFEIGRVAVRHPDFPEERYQAGIILSGLSHPERYGQEAKREYDLYDLKGILEGWFAARHLPCPDCRPADHPALLDGRSAELVLEQQTVAQFGQLKPELLRSMRLAHPVYFGLIELSRENCLHHLPQTARPLAQFPATSRDISIVVSRSLPHRDIVKAIREYQCPWLEEVNLFDLYEDEKTLGPDRRSLAYSLVYRDRERTLTDLEATRAHEQVKAHLAEQLAVEFR